MADLTGGLVSYWPLSEANGDRVDLQGSKTLTDVNTVLAGEGVGNALHQPVVADADVIYRTLVANDAWLLNQGDYHIFGWIQLILDPLAVQNIGIFDSRDSGPTTWQGRWLLDTNSIDARHYDADANTQLADLLIANSANTWYFIDFKFDAGVGEITIRRNLTSSETESMITPAGASAGLRVGFGGRRPGSNPDPGALQQVGVVNGGTLTDAELGQIYNSGNGRRWADLDEDLQDKISSMILMSEPLGTRNDPAGGFDAIEENRSKAFQGKATLSDAADFVPGSSEHLSSDDAVFQVGNTNFMIPIWVLLDDKSTDRTFISRWGAQKEFRVFYDQANDRFAFEISSDGAATTKVLANTIGSPNVNCWYLIIAWYNASGPTINIEVSETGVDSAVHAGGAFAGSNDLIVGGQANGQNYHDGRIGPIGFWKSTILDASQRTILWNNGEGSLFTEIATITLAESAIEGVLPIKAKARGLTPIASVLEGFTPIKSKVSGERVVA